MSEVPEGYRYTQEHEWARDEDGRVMVGITDYAQDQLGDVVYVSLPEIGTEVEAGQPFGEVESTKSVSDLYSPVTGRVVQRNSEVEEDPALVNSDPYGAGWLIVIESTAAGESLLSPQEYRSLIETDQGVD